MVSIDIRSRFRTPCQDSANPDLWFAEGAADLARAQELCGACPLRAACLQGALERAEPWGVWGGRIIVSGAIVAVKRGRGRPRKQAA
ncbi:MAG: WhiB family transcriptional regulator [bacterium]|nr:WhiB family transcriptional regulator [bacterium]